MQKMMKILAGLMAVGACLVVPAGYVAAAEAPAAAPKVEAVGMPNPMTEYATMAELEEALGFKPLSVPASSGYKCVHMFTYSDTRLRKPLADITSADSYGDVYESTVELSDLRYIESGGAGKLDVRSARLDNVAGEHGDISGVYPDINYRQEDQQIGATVVHITVFYINNECVAHWTNDKYAFSAVAENISNEKFLKLLSRYLVPVTECYYME